MGELFGHKKYTNFFPYAKSAVLVLDSMKRKFTTSEFIKAFNAMRAHKEKDFDPQSDKNATAANDSLRTLTEIGCLLRIKTGLYTFLDFDKTDSRKFNQLYPIVKDLNAKRKGDKYDRIHN